MNLVKFGSHAAADDDDDDGILFPAGTAFLAPALLS